MRLLADISVSSVVHSQQGLAKCTLKLCNMRTEETGMKQLVACSVKLKLRKACAFIADIFQATTSVNGIARHVAALIAAIDSKEPTAFIFMCP